jgi:pimeloyl-ACP methyl ester carboxylesterase
MSSESENTAKDLQGASRLTVDAVVGVTDIVEAMHRTISTLGGLIGDAETGRTRGITGFVYSNIRTITRLVGGGIDVALAPLMAALGEAESSRGRDAVVAALNGVLGDYLKATNNPLAIRMQIRRDGEALSADDKNLHAEIAAAGGRVLLMIHGSSSNDHQWERKGHDHGAKLAGALGFVPLYLYYNSGRHISENGEELAHLLETFVDDLPEVSEIALLTHSMGGLVARSALHYAESAGLNWRDRVAKLVCLASPHHGAPLEQYGNWVDNILQISAYTAPFARLGKIRSAGVTDLRYGYLLHEDWRGRERFELGADDSTPVPLPEDVDCYAVAATTGQDSSHVGDHIVGDGLVPMRSALGEHVDSDRALEFPESHKLVVRDTGHLDVLCSPEVYEALEGWLSE